MHPAETKTLASNFTKAVSSQISQSVLEPHLGFGLVPNKLPENAIHGLMRPRIPCGTCVVLPFLSVP